MEITELSARQEHETLAQALKVCQTCVHLTVMESADLTDALTDQESELRDKKCEFLKTGRCKIADFAVPQIFPQAGTFELPAQPIN